MIKNNGFEVFRNTESGNWIVTIAIGDTYLHRWKSTVFKSWLLYAKENDLGIIVITDHLIPKNHSKWKKPTWQKMLIGRYLTKYDIKINTICYLDTDILINPYSLNIFDFHDDEKISVVSLRKNLPFNYETTLRKLALLRKSYLDDRYPLDSALFIGLDELYAFHNLPTQEDEFCAGLLMFNPKYFGTQMYEWFEKYDRSVTSITNGGDQTHINFHVQSTGVANFIPYEFQAIWSFESANYYPFLFMDEFKNSQIFKQSIQSTLLRVNFLHFAGNWPESSKFTEGEFEMSEDFIQLYANYKNYLSKPVTGKPLGTILLN